MAQLSTSLANALLASAFCGASFTPPSGHYVALFTSDPTLGSGGEVSGGGYARQAVTFSAPSSMQTSNASTVTFPTPTAGWGLIGWAAVFDAASSGNLLMSGPLTAPQSVVSGTPVTFAAGALALNFGG